MANDVTAFALEALAAGGGPAAVAVAEALSAATQSGDVSEQQRALVALAAVCASPAASDAVAGGAVEAAVDALEAAPAHALRCLADCVRSCPVAATKATRPHVLHAVLCAAQKCAADMRVAYAATTLVAAVVAEEHVACYSVPLVVEEGALLLLNDALNCARQVSDYPLAIAALRAGGDIAAHSHYAEDGAGRIRANMRGSGLISAATNVFAEMFSSILIRDAGLAFIAAVCHESAECASHFGELKGGDGIRLVLSASRKNFRLQARSRVNSSHVEDGTSRTSTDAHPHELKSSSDLSREQNSELNRKTADALAQITLVERNCGVIRSLRGVSTIVTLVANVAHSARHVEAALISFQRCIENSQFAARDAFHAGAVAAIILAMQRHRHRASVQSHSIRSLIALIELYDCHRQAACRSFAVQAVYFALTEHGRSPEIVTLACKFMLLLSPCDIISNQICIADLLRVVSMRRGSNIDCVEVQTAATNLLEAIQFIPGDLLRKVEAQVGQILGAGMRSSGALPGSVPVTSGSIIGGADLSSSRRNVLNWRRRANTSSSLRIRTSGKAMTSARLSFPVISRTEGDVLSESRDRRFTGRTRSNNGTESLSGELHRQIEDDILAGVEKGPETFLMRQTLGRTLESARRPELECDDGISLDETRLEETLSSQTALLPDLRLNSAESSGMSNPHSPMRNNMGSPGTSAGSEPASPPWSPWTNWNGNGNNGTAGELRPFSLADMPAGTPECVEASSAGSLVPYGVSLGSGLPSTLRRGETGSLGEIY